jgi:hypothetical protein
MGLSSMIPYAPRRFCIFAQELARNTFVSVLDCCGSHWQGSALVSECPDIDDARYSNFAHMFLQPYRRPSSHNHDHDSPYWETRLPQLNASESTHPQSRQAASALPRLKKFIPEAYGTDIRTDPHMTDYCTQKWWQGGAKSGKRVKLENPFPPPLSNVTSPAPAPADLWQK